MKTALLTEIGNKSWQTQLFGNQRDGLIPPLFILDESELKFVSNCNDTQFLHFTYKDEFFSRVESCQCDIVERFSSVFVNEQFEKKETLSYSAVSLIKLFAGDAWSECSCQCLISNSNATIKSKKETIKMSGILLPFMIITFELVSNLLEYFCKPVVLF